MRVELVDGRVFEYQTEATSHGSWGGQAIDKQHGVWRQMHANGTTQSVEAELVEIDGARHLAIKGEESPTQTR